MSPSRIVSLSVAVSCLLLAGNCRSQNPSSPDKSPRIFSIVSGKSAHVCVRPVGDRACHRLTTRDGGWETGGVISPDGELVAYSSGDTPLTRSEIWVSRLDGSGARRVTGADEDALMPAFGANAHTLFYVHSGAFGHASPIVGSRRHKFDVMSVALDDTTASGAKAVQLTHQEVYELRSLAISPDGVRFLLCLNRYPKGDAIEEYDVATPLQVKRAFVPHVPGEVAAGPIFGGAAYVHDGRDIVFTSASGGFEYDYNLYQLNATTGGDIVALTHGKGMLDSFSVDRDGTIHYARGTDHHKLDPQTRAESDEDY